MRARTDTIEDHVEEGSCRFVHIDASHSYDDVKRDIQATRRLLGPRGVVAFDDYRTEHTLGTAAAVWEAVADEELRPFAATAAKLYATWSDPAPVQKTIARKLRQRPDLRAATIPLRDGPVIRIASQKLDKRPLVVDASSGPHSPVLRGLDRVGHSLNNLGYRMTRLAHQEQPGVSIRRSVDIRVDSARQRLSR